MAQIMCQYWSTSGLIYMSAVICQLRPLIVGTTGSLCLQRWYLRGPFYEFINWSLQLKWFPITAYHFETMGYTPQLEREFSIFKFIYLPHSRWMDGWMDGCCCSGSPNSSRANQNTPTNAQLCSIFSVFFVAATSATLLHERDVGAWCCILRRPHPSTRIHHWYPWNANQGTFFSDTRRLVAVVLFVFFSGSAVFSTVCVF